MDNIDSKSCSSRALVREITRRVRNGELSRGELLKHYKIRELAWKDAKSQHLDIGGKTLKSLHTILQIGLFFTTAGRVAVFSRPSTERDGTAKITSSFSVLKSWSPTSLDEEDLAIDLAKKVHLRAGPTLTWQERGLAFTDIFERQNRFAPHYLFVLYEIPLEDKGRIDTKAHLNQRKNTEHFAGWFNPRTYDSHSFQAEFFDPLDERHRSIRFDGAVDRLLLTSLERQDSESLEDTTRGLARYYPNHNLIRDTDKCDFGFADVDIDEHMSALLKVIQAIKDTNDDQEMEVTLQDVVMFEPNFMGIGIRGPAFLQWIKRLYNRAFN